MVLNEEKQQIVLALAATIQIPGLDSQKVAQFCRILFDRLPLTLLTKLTNEDLEKIITMTWSSLQQPFINNPIVYLRSEYVSLHKTPRLFLTLINVNRPYIIDSLQSFLTRWNIKPQILLHPVISTQRDEKGDLQHIQHDYQQITQQSSNARFESVVFMMAKHKFSDAELQQFEADLKRMLQQLCWVVDDQIILQENLRNIESHLNRSDVSKWCPDDSKDTKEFLDWLQTKYFLFLGGRYFKLKMSETNNAFFCLEEGGVTEVTGLYRDALIASADDLVPAIARAKIIPDEKSTPSTLFPLVSVLKTSHRSPIHRHSRVDSVEILDWSEDGKIQGVYQFIGIFKKELFNLSAFDIPWLKKKAQNIFDQFNVDPSWYDGKILISIIDSIPRDEMFYHDQEQLTHICHRVLELQEHPGDVAVFIRHDLYGRYLTVMVYLPRERYSFSLKDRLGQIVCEHLKGDMASSVAQVGDLPYARIIFVLNFAKPQHVKVDVKQLEYELSEASMSWIDRFDRHIDQESIEETASQNISLYRQGFSSSYQDRFTVEEAFSDAMILESLLSTRAVDLNLYEAASQQLKVKIYHVGAPLSLAVLLPILSNFGIKVLSETTYRVQKLETSFHIHDFEIQLDPTINWYQNQIFLSLAFQEIWMETTENDGFNQLILTSGLTVRQVSLLRAYGKYLLQIKVPYSQGYIESTLAAYPLLSALLVEYFESKFQINRENLREIEDVANDFLNRLQDVTRLDHDKIFRRLLNALQATVRTNYYQLDVNGQAKEYISFKFSCAALEDLPQPRPLYEIYIYSSRVEAIHLRGGKVARGGLRWSDRYEDYRTEVLGLMKAQMVKNSVIVPLGSKGGFIVKRQPQISNRSDLQQEVIRCYQIMICGLLDITDNLVSGNVVPPSQVIRYDQDDPYLVVAADKGTATFSDIANAISQEYGFWLDDAFASGGSAGYDHKKMAITSRGAWESVMRHFREMGHNIQTQPFTVIGIGDMSGDVFGNGMLRSQKIRLLAAFDHRHIFIDPNPDEAVTFAERARLFDVPRSSWADYNLDLISKGGGVYSRDEKMIVLSPEAQQTFNLSQNHYVPEELIKILLRFEVDLLWFGGIGTFIKATPESNLEVGDMANLHVRVNAKTVGAKVIGEGANLGMTQLARIEYALNGGRINTDAIDNSAGVDCSDHEVNIKVLFNAMPEKIERLQRDQILRQMTDEVAQLVLQDNYRQTLILSILQMVDISGLNTYQSLIKSLEAEENLDRTIEFLPDDEQIERRLAKNQGLTRPELAVLLAYSKIHLYNRLLQADVLDKPLFRRLLLAYFPTYIQENYVEAVFAHPLRREIISTVIANELINRVGPTFIHEICRANGLQIHQVVEAFFIATQLLKLDEMWASIDALDNKMITSVQINAYQQIAQVLRIAVLHLLGQDCIVPDAQVIDQLIQHLPMFLSPTQLEERQARIEELESQGVDNITAQQLALILYLPSILEIASAEPSKDEALSTAKVYFNIKSTFGIDWLESMVYQLNIETEWQRSAQLSLLNDLGMATIALLKQALVGAKSNDPTGWIDNNQAKLIQVQSLLTSLRGSTRPDFGLLGFIIRQFQQAT